MLEDVLITEELSRRTATQSASESLDLTKLQAENQVLRTLAWQLANTPTLLLQSLVNYALDLCQAGTAGISVLEIADDGSARFCWATIAGTLSSYVGNITPRHASFCGICLDQAGESDDRAPQLFCHPERYFTDLQGMKIPIVETLVLPLVAGGQALGTIWILSHDEARHFDSEEVES